MILLDTCTVLWLAQGAPLPTAVEAVLSSDNPVFVSAISAWEIGVKAARGRLTLPLPAARWWTEVLDAHTLAEVPVDGAIALRSAELPPLHADPADRILVATALHLRARLLTPDPLIAAYPGIDTLWR
jgi:PIN domain nuclease of toxin-antitoxin system